MWLSGPFSSMYFFMISMYFFLLSEKSSCSAWWMVADELNDLIWLESKSRYSWTGYLYRRLRDVRQTRANGYFCSQNSVLR